MAIAYFRSAGQQVKGERRDRVEVLFERDGEQEGGTELTKIGKVYREAMGGV